jgi:O-antigen ligase
LRIGAAEILDRVLFYSLLILIGLVAIPYGTVEPWWKAAFQSLVFILAGFSVIEYWLRNGTATDSFRSRFAPRGTAALLLPIIALMVFAFGQTLTWPQHNIGGVSVVYRTLSSDPFQTRVFVVQIFALAVFGGMLIRHTRNQRQLYFLIETIIAVAVISAGFGLLRQATQEQVGFGLPHLRPAFGYAQFINSNHFAFLMEMALGLTLGIAVCSRARGLRPMLYLIAAIPMWVAVVLSNSRGGILSILCQVVLLGGLLVTGTNEETPEAKRRFSRTGQIVRNAVLVSVLLMGSAVIVAFVGGDPLAQRTNNLPVELNQKTAETYTLRRNIWQATGNLIKDHPITGVGFGGYWIAIVKYHRASGETSPQQAHNDYLELLASGGVIGVAIGIWFSIVLIRLARDAWRTANPPGRAVIVGASTGIVTVAVHSLVDFGLHITINSVIFTALIALLSIVLKQSSKPIRHPA